MADTTEIITAENDGSLTAKTIVYVNPDGTFTKQGKERAMRLLKGLGFDTEKFYQKVVLNSFYDRTPCVLYRNCTDAINSVNVTEINDIDLRIVPDNQLMYLLGVLHTLEFLQENIKP